MTEITGTTSGGEAIFQTELPADAPESFNSPTEAAAYFTALKEAATADPELAKANADPEEVPSEDTPDADPQEAEPIEPPRSWTKAEKERFQSLPRETQEYLHTREQEREREFRRSQNDIAEQRNAVKAEREAAEKARQQYEAQLPTLKDALLRAQSESFSDIKTWDDVKNLQKTDPFRYQEWDVHQKELGIIDTQAREAEARRAQEQSIQWTEHVQKENALAAEYIPELADKVKGPALTQRAAERLNELGFKPDELNALASGKEKLSLYDHRIQRLIFSDLKLSDIQSAPKAVAKPDLPPVQKPGTTKPPGSTVSDKIQALEAKFNRTGELRDAQALYAAQLEAQSRRRAS